MDGLLLGWSKTRAGAWQKSAGNGSREVRALKPLLRAKPSQSAKSAFLAQIAEDDQGVSFRWARRKSTKKCIFLEKPRFAPLNNSEAHLDLREISLFWSKGLRKN
jgi:hypothetical protein